MARSAPRKTALTSSPNPQLERQARRISRQQKQLAKELAMEAAPLQVKLTGAGSRAIKLSNLKRLQPLTDTQEDFFDAYDNPDNMAFVLGGHAGSGKSYIACAHALRDVLDPETPYEKILIMKPQVAMVSSGFLPGTIEDKLAPYEAPYHGIFADLLGRPDAYDKLKEMGKLEFIMDSYVRSHTFNDSIIIYDEIQNLTFSNIHGVLTRIGKNTKVIVCGDGKQSDLNKRREEKTGFYDFIMVAGSMPEFQMFEFTVSDVVRSGFCRSWIIAAEAHNML